MRALPIGIQTFEDIREKGFVYVDKTGPMTRLVLPGKGYYFLSRPRRFGKSVLVSTLAALFEGKRRLFEGLQIAESGFDFSPHPVLRLDFSAMNHHQPHALEQSLLASLTRLAEERGITTPAAGDVETVFAHLVRRLANVKQVVILIDEYDKPIIDHVDQPVIAEANRMLLRRFYGVIKSLDAHIRFMFVTGITKFARVSIFSDLNNLYDLSLDQTAADLVGWTESEVTRFFPAHLDQFAESVSLPLETLLDHLRYMYNGYRFSEGETTVYNPWSVLNALQRRQFRNFWYDSGSPHFLMKVLRDRLSEQSPFLMRDLYDYKVRADLLPAFDVEKLNIFTLLFQTGYLTIKATSGTLRESYLHLGFPNQEVEQSMLFTVLSSLTSVEQGRAPDHLDQLISSLQAEDFEAFFGNLRTNFFARISYELHIPLERYYQTLFHTIFLLLNVRSGAEVHTHRGRMDHVLELDKAVFIFEFKFGKDAAAGLLQIQQKRYDEPYLGGGKTIFHVGVNFAERNIADYAIKTIPPGT